MPRPDPTPDGVKLYRDDTTERKIASAYAALNEAKGPAERAWATIGRVIDAVTGRRERHRRRVEAARQEAMARARRWGGSAPPT